MSYVGHFDVSTAFLHSDIDRDLYLKPPARFETPGKLWHLKKSLYGLKQSSRNWYLHLKDILKDCHLTQSDADFGLFFHSATNVYFLVYVDDILVVAPTESDSKRLFAMMVQRGLNMKDLGPVKQFLGWQIERKKSHFEVHQTNYICDVVDRFGLRDSKPLQYPMHSFVLGDENQEVDENLLNGNHSNSDSGGSLLKKQKKTREFVLLQNQHKKKKSTPKALYKNYKDVLPKMREELEQLKSTNSATTSSGSRPLLPEVTLNQL